MMYGWWDGNSAPWFGMLFGPVMMIALVVATVLVAAWALRLFGLGRQSAPSDVTPLETLKQRFARGEIDHVEYEERKRRLTSA